MSLLIHTIEAYSLGQALNKNRIFMSDIKHTSDALIQDDPFFLHHIL